MITALLCVFNVHCLGYSKIFNQLLYLEPTTSHPKISKHELWEFKSSLRSIEETLNQDSIEQNEREHIQILAQYYAAGPLMICKRLHCSRCDFTKYQRRELLKLLTKAKNGKQILDYLRADIFLKNHAPFLNALNKMQLVRKRYCF